MANGSFTRPNQRGWHTCARDCDARDQLGDTAWRIQRTLQKRCTHRISLSQELPLTASRAGADPRTTTVCSNCKKQLLRARLSCNTPAQRASCCRSSCGPKKHPLFRHAGDNSVKISQTSNHTVPTCGCVCLLCPFIFIENIGSARCGTKTSGFGVPTERSDVLWT